MTSSTLTPSIRRTAPAGFTLTEVLIALGLVAFLLVGISRIFAITSQTIAAGQSLSKAMRAQRAIQQSMAADFLGVGAVMNDPLARVGMTPLVDERNRSSGAPFLTISNFRTPAYLNEADAKADPTPPNDSLTDFGQRSALIRSGDFDGDESTPEETLSLYTYGVRNFRCDTIGFFSSGSFRSQNVDATSTDAYIWYGHLRVFNSNVARTGYSNAYGAPGDFQTPGTTGGATAAGPNRNSLYAEQFILGRFQLLMIEPIDHDGDGDQTTSTPKTVVANNDPQAWINFASRTWRYPTDTNGTAGTLSPSPFNFGTTSIKRFYKDTPGDPGDNEVIDGNGVPKGTALPKYGVDDGRTDVIGAGMRQMRQRVQHLGQLFANGTNGLPADWLDRFYVNPFVSSDPTNPLSRTTLAQRQHLLANASPQMIVEFAGDFVTQDAVTGAPAGGAGHPRPDGVLDFVSLEDPVTTQVTRAIRWYGLPRDADNDGDITGRNNPGMVNSPDVVPVSDFAGVPAGSFSFEKKAPAQAANYITIINEPSGAFTTPSDTSYLCVWGPNEFDTPRNLATDPPEIPRRYNVPQLIRILVDMVDPDGKLKEPVTQEYVFPVPIQR